MAHRDSSGPPTEMLEGLANKAMKMQVRQDTAIHPAFFKQSFHFAPQPQMGSSQGRTGRHKAQCQEALGTSKQGPYMWLKHKGMGSSREGGKDCSKHLEQKIRLLCLPHVCVVQVSWHKTAWSLP